ncbi:hypothetical protein Zmor_008510 [Zophobas morio]|uniref:Odorant receptor n=1 Tax=Zophobas morio TaxID=2755281 RepID=A0AA38MQZ4_9CUCU|nr:hypothetical protein Zmor_008510 [Zophobas morio]
MFLTTVSLLQLVLFLQKFNLHYFIQFGPSFFIILYLLTALIYVPQTKKLVLEYVQELKHDNNSSCKDNKKELIRAVTYMISSLIFAVIAGILFAIPSEEDKDIFYPFSLSQEFFPELEYFVTWGFKCCCVPLGCAGAISPAHYLAYAVLHFKLQANVLLHNIENINKNYENNEFLDTESQNVIKKRLLFCLKHHISVSRYTKTSMRRAENLVLILELEGCFLFISIVIHIFTVDELTSQLWYWRFLLLTLCSFLVLSGNSTYGQKIEDASDDIFYRLVNVKWYNWNQENKELYLMFLTNTQKPFRLKFSENISMNCRQGVEIGKTFFSFMSVAYQLRNSIKH